MADPLEQLSDSDLHALSKNDLESMSDAGLKIVAASGSAPAKEEPPKEEPWGHWAIRQGLPLAGQISGGLGAGALATPETAGIGTIPAAMAGASAGNVAGNEAAGWLNHKIYGDEAPTYDSVDDLKRVGVNAAVGAGAELGGQVIGKGLSAAANSAVIKPWLDEAGQLVMNGFNKAGQYVGSKAEALAVKATGATGAEARNFAPGTGRTLLDRGIVKFGRSQAGIADAAQTALDEQGNVIQNSIQDLTEKGAEKRADWMAQRQSLLDQKADIQTPKSFSNYETATEMNARVKGVPYDQRITELSEGEIPNSLKHKMQTVDALTNPPAPYEPTFSTPGFEPKGNTIAERAADLARNHAAPFGSEDKILQYPVGNQTGIGTGDIDKALDSMNLLPGSKQDLLSRIDGKIASLADDTSQAQVVQQLNGIRDAIAMGPEMPNLAQLETSKRGFQSMVNYANPEGNTAKAAAADVYRQSAEDLAAQTDYKSAKEFIGAKKMYGQLEPVAEAGEKRAMQVQQSPTGGLGDMVSYGVGGVPAVIAKKTIFPRINSSLAASANGLSQILAKTPQVFGKYAPALAAAAARGETALAASAYVLQQRDPEFRQKMQDLDKTNTDISPLTKNEQNDGRTN